MKDNCENQDCGVHFRVNQRVKDSSNGDYLNVTYVNDHAVVTTIHPDWEDLVSIVRMMVTGNTADMWYTGIFHVGSGALLDSDADMRWVETHDDWGNLDDVHEMVVGSLQAETLDLGSKVAF